MRCKNIHKKLIFYIDDELHQSEIDEIKAHINSCNNCLFYYNELLKTLKLVDKKKMLKTNPFLYTRIKQHAKNAENEKVQPILRPEYGRILQTIIVLCVITLSGFFGVSIGNVYNIDNKKSDIVSVSSEFYFNDLKHEALEAYLLTVE